jgi:UDP-glucose 6-dehydrogenase
MKEGATVRAYDPVAMDNAAPAYCRTSKCAHDATKLRRSRCTPPGHTNGNEFMHLDLAKIKQLMKTPSWSMVGTSTIRNGEHARLHLSRDGARLRR